MSNFFRALRFAWPHRYRFGLSLLCALLVAVMWGGNLSAVYPILKVFFRNQNLQTWIDQEKNFHVVRVWELVEGRDELESRLGVLSAAGPADAVAGDRQAIAAQLRTLQLELVRAQWKQHWYERVGHVIHRYFPQGRGETLACVLLLLIVGLGLKGVFIYFNDTLVGSVTQLTMFDLKNRLYRHSMKMDLATFTQSGTSELMARFTNDMETLATGMETAIGKMIREPLKALACISLACWLNWRLTLVVLLLVPVAVLLMGTIGRCMKRATRRCLESMSSIYQILQESFQGIKIVKAFAMEPYERRRFFQETKRYYRKSMRIVKLEALTSPATEMIGIGAISMAVLIGAYLVIGETEWAKTHILGMRMAAAPMDPESLLLLYTFLAGVSDPVRKLSNVYGRMQRAAAASDRLFAFLDRSPTILDRAGATRLVRHRRSIEFKDVQFAYPTSLPVLKGISLRVQSGEAIAIVGPNGCGKTTLLSLIPRFYDATGGQVLVDGVDVRDIQLRSLRRQIGIVTQETVLFDDTILANIAYGSRHASRAAIEVAARQAYAHRFIEQLPEGYDTNVGERAVKLSGGQRQRIALARAILRDPSILILDEATSALDVESESLIQRALEEFVENRTTFVITHRLATLEMADRIVVMSDGRIEDVGLHNELMRRCELYARLYQIHSASRCA